MSLSESKNKILLIVTGSIACYKSADLTSKLKQAGYRVKVVLSESAQQFVTPLTFEALSGEKVHTSLWEPDESLAHIDLVRWADLVLVAPATADFLAHLAQGRAQNLSLALSIAHDFSKPFLIAPAMNPAMYQHPSVQENLVKLKNWGYMILPSPEGLMACQESGSGRMLEVSELIEAVESALTLQVTSPKKVILTCGGTSTAIDSVRRITNFSSGQTGFEISKQLLRAGHQVTLIRSKQSRNLDASLGFHSLTSRLRILEFESADELDSQLFKAASLAPTDYLIQCAAISDFDIAETAKGKISSKAELNLKLVPRKKSLVTFCEQFPSIKVVAFKLTVNATIADVEQKLSELVSIPSIEKVIHNHFESVISVNPNYTVFNRDLSSSAKCENVLELGQWMSNYLGRLL